MPVPLYSMILNRVTRCKSEPWCRSDSIHEHNCDNAWPVLHDQVPCKSRNYVDHIHNDKPHGAARGKKAT